MTEEQPEYEYEPVLRSDRPPGWLVTVALTGLTGACLGGLIYAVLFDGPGTESALTTLGTLATIGLTGLLALAGVDRKDGT